MELTNEQRKQFLKSYNDLRNMLLTIYDCQDIWMSDVGKLENLQHIMHSVMKFVPQEDDEGRPMHYADWVLADTDDESL
jgi:hypothetical protein